MPLGVNAIALAEKLSTQEDPILELQKHWILPTSYTCPNCEVTTEKVEVEAKSNYHYFRCSCCKSRTSLRYLFVCFHTTICVQISIVVCSRTGTLLFGKKIEMRSFLLIAYFFVATCLMPNPWAAHSRDWFILWEWYFPAQHREQDLQTDCGVLPRHL